MNEIIIITISLIANPIIALFLYKASHKYNFKPIALSVSILLVAILIIGLSADISFINNIYNIVFVALAHLGICYILWSLIFVKQKWLRVIGIIITSVFFLVSFIISIGSTSTLHNEVSNPHLKYTNEGYRVRMNVLTISPKKGIEKTPVNYFTMQVYKEFGPLQYEVKSVSYQKEKRSNDLKYECRYNGDKDEIKLIGISKRNGAVAWEEIIE